MKHLRTFEAIDQYKWNPILGGRLFYKFITKKEFDYLIKEFNLKPGSATYSYLHPLGKVEINATSGNLYDIAVENDKVKNAIDELLKTKKP